MTDQSLPAENAQSIWLDGLNWSYLLCQCNEPKGHAYQGPSGNWRSVNSDLSLSGSQASSFDRTVPHNVFPFSFFRKQLKNNVNAWKGWENFTSLIYHLKVKKKSKIVSPDHIQRHIYFLILYTRSHSHMMDMISNRHSDYLFVFWAFGAVVVQIKTCISFCGLVIHQTCNSDSP